MEYALFIPTTGNLELLDKAYNSVRLFFGEDNIFIIDNSPEEKLSKGELSTNYKNTNSTVLCVDFPLRFVDTMNIVQKYAIGWKLDVYFWMHDDAEVEDPFALPKLFEQVRNLYDSKAPWSVVFTHYDLLSAVNVEAIKSIGPWDRNLSQYYSDNDYYRRCRLAGYPTHESHIHVKHHNNGSNTIKAYKGVEIIAHNYVHDLSRRYYLAKWGGEPPYERFDKPFNYEGE